MRKLKDTNYKSDIYKIKFKHKKMKFNRMN